MNEIYFTMIYGNYGTHRQSPFCFYKSNPSSENLKWIKNGYKPNSQSYEKSKTAAWLFPAPWQTSLLFDRTKPFLAVGLTFHNEKKMVKIHFLRSPVIGTPILLDRSYRHWQKTSQTSWRLLFLLTTSVIRQGPQKKKKGIGYIRLNRLLNMTIIFMTFCLTYYWLLIFVFRYERALLKSLMVWNNLVIYNCG